jgi:hypothetical protein
MDTQTQETYLTPSDYATVEAGAGDGSKDLSSAGSLDTKQYVLARWKGQPAKWYERLTGRVYTDGQRNVYQGQLEISYICNAENLEDAKLKFNVGASKFSNVHKGKSIYDAELTTGDRTAIRRTAGGIIGQLSDEGVTFLLTIAGIVPSSIGPTSRRMQLQQKIVGNRLTSAPRHGKLDICGN